MYVNMYVYVYKNTWYMYICVCICNLARETLKKLSDVVFHKGWTKHDFWQANVSLSGIFSVKLTPFVFLKRFFGLYFGVQCTCLMSPGITSVKYYVAPKDRTYTFKDERGFEWKWIAISPVRFIKHFWHWWDQGTQNSVNIKGNA